MNAALVLTLAWLGAADMHPLLHSPPDTAWFVSNSGDARSTTAAVILRCADAAAVDTIAAHTEALGGRIRGRLRTVPALLVECPTAMLDAVAATPSVIWMEPAPPPLQPCMDSARPAVGVDTLHEGPLELTGASQRLVIIEPALPDPDHTDFDSRLTAWDSGGSAVHATHVAGTMIGSGAASGGLWVGVAPQASLDAHVITNVDDYYFYSDPGTLESIYEDELESYQPAAFNQSLGSNIQANGYPCSLHGDYGITSELIDGLVRGSLGTPVTSVWAVGNERSSNDCGYDYGTVGQPGGAKNIISVGAVYSDSGVVTIFSSWGPTDDGRIKPDLVAPGSQLSDDFGVTSCDDGGGYRAMSGTSMAAPIVTGTIALLSEAHGAAWPDAQRPLPSTWRAILCHTAKDLLHPGPDYRSGWGLLDAAAAAETVTNHDWIESLLGSGDLETAVIEVGPEGGPLKVTLAWDDPASVAGSPGLEHDLTLYVVDPDGTWHAPWTLDPSNPTAAATRSTVDSINPIEQVFVDDAAPGTWQIHVLAGAISDPEGQAYTLVSEPPMARTLLTIVEAPSQGTHWEASPVRAGIDAVGESVVDGTAALYASVDGAPVTATTLTLQQDGTWAGSLPPAPCGSNIDWWISVESTLTGAHTLPLGAPGSTFGLPVEDAASVVLSDSFDTDQGWSVTGDASKGHWARGVPTAACEDDGEPPADAGPDSAWCFMTDPGIANACEDVDNGCTVLTSPQLDTTAEGLTLAYSRWFSNDTCGHNHDDEFLVEFSVNGGASWTTLETVSENSPQASGQWYDVAFELDEVPGFSATDAFHLRFSACDTGSTGCVEAAVDSVTITGPPCLFLCREDIAEANGAIDVTDLLSFIAAFGTADPAADLDGDGEVTVDDLLLLMAAWGPCAA